MFISLASSYVTLEWNCPEHQLRSNDLEQKPQSSSLSCYFSQTPFSPSMQPVQNLNETALWL